MFDFFDLHLTFLMFVASFYACRWSVNFNTQNINLLLTEREGRTGEYWPEVVTVCTKTTEGQYSPVWSRAREVSK